MLAGKFEFHSISVDPRYQDYSFSELRWQFYQSRQQGEEKTEEEMVDEEKDNETETCDRIVDLILKSPALQAYLPKLVRIIGFSSVCVSVYVSVRVSVCLSVRLFVCLFVRLSVRPSVCSFVCLCVCLSSVCLFICLCVRLSICPVHVPASF